MTSSPTTRSFASATLRPLHRKDVHCASAGRSTGFVVRARLDGLRDTLAERLSSAKKPKLAAVLTEWQGWFDNRFGFQVRNAPGTRLGLSRFSLAAPHPDGGALVLDAPEYLGDGVDWSTLQLGLAGDGPTDLPADRTQQLTVTAAYPQPLRWPGCPSIVSGDARRRRQSRRDANRPGRPCRTSRTRHRRHRQHRLVACRSRHPRTGCGTHRQGHGHRHLRQCDHPVRPQQPGGT
jgi:hypothetical protein